MTSNLSIFENEMSKWIIGCVEIQKNISNFRFWNNMSCECLRLTSISSTLHLCLRKYKNRKVEILFRNYRSFTIKSCVQSTFLGKLKVYRVWLHLPKNWSVFQAGKICFQDLCEIRPRNGRPKIKKKEELNLELISYPACETKKKNQFIFNGRKVRRRNALKL